MGTQGIYIIMYNVTKTWYHDNRQSSTIDIAIRNCMRSEAKNAIQFNTISIQYNTLRYDTIRQDTIYSMQYDTTRYVMQYNIHAMQYDTTRYVMQYNIHAMQYDTTRYVMCAAWAAVLHQIYKGELKGSGRYGLSRQLERANSDTLYIWLVECRDFNSCVLRNYLLIV
jgi:hypothetical protein